MPAHNANKQAIDRAFIEDQDVDRVMAKNDGWVAIGGDWGSNIVSDHLRNAFIYFKQSNYCAQNNYSPRNSSIPALFIVQNMKL